MEEMTPEDLALHEDIRKTLHSCADKWMIRKNIAEAVLSIRDCPQDIKTLVRRVYASGAFYGASRLYDSIIEKDRSHDATSRD